MVYVTSTTGWPAKVVNTGSVGTREVEGRAGPVCWSGIAAARAPEGSTTMTTNRPAITELNAMHDLVLAQFIYSVSNSVVAPLNKTCSNLL